MKKGEIPKKLLLAVANSENKDGLSFTEEGASGISPFVDWYRSQNKFGRYRIRKGFQDLQTKGLIKLIPLEGKTKVVLTETGLTEVQRHKIDLIKPIPLPIWDGKWRVIVPTTKTNTGLRNRFKEMGFYVLKNNIWIYPYPCKKEVETVLSLLKMNEEVKYLEATFIEGESEIKKYFGI